MGMYTELVMAVELRKDTPPQIIETLQYMLNENKYDRDVPFTPKLPDHPLFKTERWQWMLVCDSAYFSGDTHSTLNTRYDEAYYLTIRCNLKNYKSEIELFLDWIDEYAAMYDRFIGYYRYEECELPNLIMRDYKGIKIIRVFDNGTTDEYRLRDRLFADYETYRQWWSKKYLEKHLTVRNS